MKKKTKEFLFVIIWVRGLFACILFIHAFVWLCVRVWMCGVIHEAKAFIVIIILLTYIDNNKEISNSLAMAIVSLTK